MQRRTFAKNIGFGLLATQSLPTFAATRLLNNDNSRIPIGLCNHSLRGMRLNARQLIEYAIEQKLDSVLLNTLQPFESLGKENLVELKNLAYSSGVSIYTGVGSISEKSVHFSSTHKSAKVLIHEGIRVALTVGSPVVGVRIGSIKDRYSDGGIEAHIEAVIAEMKLARAKIQDAGLKFAFENHMGDLRTEELLSIVNETGTDICGALFDPANALWAMEDPMITLKKLGSNIICTSVRDIQVWETNEGVTFQGMAIGKGLLDFPLFAKIMNEKCPGVPMHIETISNSARSIPYLTSEFWEGYPNLSAVGIVDFIKLIKRGTPQEIIQPSGGTDKRTFDIELQQKELLTSIKYLREQCKAGLNK